MIRVDFDVNHCMTIVELIDKEREVRDWCYKNFGEDSWVIGPGIGYASFDNEDEAMWFRLRWA